MGIDVIQITDAELNKLIIETFGKKKFISESMRVPLMLKWQLGLMLPLPKNVKEINALALKGEYQAIYDVLQKNRMLSNKGKWYNDNVLILVCYYRMNKFEEAKQLIESQNFTTYNLPSCIMMIASKVGANFIPKAGSGTTKINMTVLENKNQLFNCPNCGSAIVEKTGSFCIYCGTKLH